MSQIPVSTKKHDAGRIPGPAACPNTVEVRLQWLGANGRTFYSFLHGSFTGTFLPTVAIANTIFSAISSSWSTNLASFSPTACTLAGAQIRDMTSASNPVFASTAAAVAGTSVSVAMPESVALVLTEEVNQRGRGAKGRIYVPNWATNADASGGLALGTVVTAMNNWGTGIFNALNGSSLTPCVAKVARQQYVGYSGATHNARSAAPVAISAYTCQDARWDSQRRRTQP